MASRRARKIAAILKESDDNVSRDAARSDPDPAAMGTDGVGAEPVLLGRGSMVKGLPQSHPPKRTLEPVLDRVATNGPGRGRARPLLRRGCAVAASSLLGPEIRRGEYSPAQPSPCNHAPSPAVLLDLARYSRPPDLPGPGPCARQTESCCDRLLSLSEVFCCLLGTISPPLLPARSTAGVSHGVR